VGLLLPARAVTCRRRARVRRLRAADSSSPRVPCVDRPGSAGARPQDASNCHVLCTWWDGRRGSRLPQRPLRTCQTLPGPRLTPPTPDLPSRHAQGHPRDMSAKGSNATCFVQPFRHHGRRREWPETRTWAEGDSPPGTVRFWTRPGSSPRRSREPRLGRVGLSGHVLSRRARFTAGQARPGDRRDRHGERSYDLSEELPRETNTVDARSTDLHVRAGAVCGTSATTNVASRNPTRTAASRVASRASRRRALPRLQLLLARRLRHGHSVNPASASCPESPTSLRRRLQIVVPHDASMSYEPGLQFTYVLRRRFDDNLRRISATNV